MSDKPNPNIEQYHRLSADSYKQLASQVPGISVDEETSAHRAGFLLGIQFVLQKLREGFVVG